MTAPYGDPRTENDAIIAAILAEEDCETADSCTNAGSHPRSETRALQEEGRVEDDLQTAIAIAIMESLGEVGRPEIASRPEPRHSSERARQSAIPDLTQAPTCPICTYALSAEHKSGEIIGAEPLKAFCPECIHVFHNACLGRWFREDRDPVCPMCRREMDDDFVEEVINDWDKKSIDTDDESGNE